jgi:hypothetical protein
VTTPLFASQGYEDHCRKSNENNHQKSRGSDQNVWQLCDQIWELGVSALSLQHPKSLSQDEEHADHSAVSCSYLPHQKQELGIQPV